MFVLLAFLIQPDQRVKDFLAKELGIDPVNGVESVLFVLREPPWASKEGDPRFGTQRVGPAFSRSSDEGIAGANHNQKVKEIHLEQKHLRA